VGEWEVEPLRAAVEVLVRPGTFTRAELLWPLRVALTGEKQSPDVFDVALALGRERSLLRLKAAQNTLGAA
jgi:glutamyl/glutaminyl-tRNA synthetase